MTIEEYLNKPYWVIDILPKQVPADGRGQYFKIEEYYLEHPQIDDIYRKFTNILLKLNCYNDINVSHDGDEWITNHGLRILPHMNWRLHCWEVWLTSRCSTSS